MYMLGSDLRHSSAPMPCFNTAFKIPNHKARCISISSTDASRSLGIEGSHWTWLKLRHMRAHKANAPSNAWRPPQSAQRPQNNNCPRVQTLVCLKTVRCTSSATWDGCPRARGCPGTGPRMMRVSPPNRGTGECEPPSPSPLKTHSSAAPLPLIKLSHPDATYSLTNKSLKNKPSYFPINPTGMKEKMTGKFFCCLNTFKYNGERGEITRHLDSFQRAMRVWGVKFCMFICIFLLFYIPPSSSCVLFIILGWINFNQKSKRETRRADLPRGTGETG